jgi:hypothetical protein
MIDWWENPWAPEQKLVFSISLVSDPKMATRRGATRPRTGYSWIHRERWA